jgi:hypothetical protein
MPELCPCTWLVLWIGRSPDPCASHKTINTVSISRKGWTRSSIQRDATEATTGRNPAPSVNIEPRQDTR